MILITELRRKRLRSNPFPKAWETAIERNVPVYLRLPEADRLELKQHIQVFLAEKRFEGKGGMTITDEVRVIIAAQACLLLLHRQTDYFPGLSSIIVYPGEYLAPLREIDEWGVVTIGTDRRSGESCQEGALVLSWEDVLAKGIDMDEDYNVVLHEFAHQLDLEDGISALAMLLPKRSRHRALKDILEREHRQLQEDEAHGRATVIDPYGAENLEEFFAVATEAFFQIPAALREHHPELYGELSRYYRQDPAGWLQPGKSSGGV